MKANLLFLFSCFLFSLVRARSGGEGNRQFTKQIKKFHVVQRLRDGACNAGVSDNDRQASGAGNRYINPVAIEDEVQPA